MTDALREALRVVHVTAGRGDAREIVSAVRASVAAGVRCVQLREPGLSARDLAAVCERLRPDVAAVDGRLIVNDRADLVAAGLADGVHLGWRSLPAAVVRRFLPDTIVGVSAHDAAELAAARDAGATYATLSPVHPTRSHPETEPLGVDRAAALTRGAGLPVVWLGGFDAARIRAARAAPAVGFAVLSALDPVAGAADAPGDGDVDRRVRSAAAELVAAATVASAEMRSR